MILEVGFAFHPTDEELVRDYLLNKLLSPSRSFHPIIKEFDLYGQMEPWDIWNSFGGPALRDDEDLYFFTRLKKVSAKRISRKLGGSGGTWHGEDSGNKFPVVGRSWTLKKFSYNNKNNMEQHGRWLLYEYCLDGVEECVLCRLKRNYPGKKRKYSQSEKDQVICVDWDDDNDVTIADHTERSKIDDHDVVNHQAVSDPPGLRVNIGEEDFMSQIRSFEEYFVGDTDPKEDCSWADDLALEALTNTYWEETFRVQDDGDNQLQPLCLPSNYDSMGCGIDPSSDPILDRH